MERPPHERASAWGAFRARKVPCDAAPITLAFDARGVPTITAQSIPDAMFGLGYAHARDRLWQMELFRRVAQGRLSEVLGLFVRALRRQPGTSLPARRACESRATG